MRKLLALLMISAFSIGFAQETAEVEPSKEVEATAEVAVEAPANDAGETAENDVVVEINE